MIQNHVAAEHSNELSLKQFDEVCIHSFEFIGTQRMWMATMLCGSGGGDGALLRGLVNPRNLLRHDPQPLLSKGVLQLAHSAERNFKASESRFELLSTTAKRRRDDEDIASELERVSRRNREIRQESIPSGSFPSRFTSPPIAMQVNKLTPVSGVNLFNTSLAGRRLFDEEFEAESTAAETLTIINGLRWSVIWTRLRQLGWSWHFNHETDPTSDLYFLPGRDTRSPDNVLGVNMFDGEQLVRIYLARHISQYNEIFTQPNTPPQGKLNAIN